VPGLNLRREKHSVQTDIAARTQLELQSEYPINTAFWLNSKVSPGVAEWGLNFYDRKA
jgi:hypothetical protein